MWKTGPTLTSKFWSTVWSSGCLRFAWVPWSSTRSCWTSRTWSNWFRTSRNWSGLWSEWPTTSTAWTTKLRSWRSCSESAVPGCPSNPSCLKSWPLTSSCCPSTTTRSSRTRSTRICTSSSKWVQERISYSTRSSINSETTSSSRITSTS